MRISMKAVLRCLVVAGAGVSVLVFSSYFTCSSRPLGPVSKQVRDGHARSHDDKHPDDTGDRNATGPAVGITARNSSTGMRYRSLELDHNGSSRALWPQDPACAHMRVRFGKRVDGTLLHSFPRSGNTWVRYLLEGATGVFTSSVYTDKTLIKAGFLGEQARLQDHTTIVTKVHFVRHLRMFRTTPAITIIRNPARAVVSLWNYLKVRRRRRRHLAVVPDATFNSSEFRIFCKTEVRKWMVTTRFALKQTHRSLLPVYYEHLREDPLREVRRMLQFLRLRPDEERLTCLARHVEGKMRSGPKNINHFTGEEMKQVQEAVDAVNSLLDQRGFPSLPDYSKY